MLQMDGGIHYLGTRPVWWYMETIVPRISPLCEECRATSKQPFFRSSFSAPITILRREGKAWGQLRTRTIAPTFKSMNIDEGVIVEQRQQAEKPRLTNHFIGKKGKTCRSRIASRFISYDWIGNGSIRFLLYGSQIHLNSSLERIKGTRVHLCFLFISHTTLSKLSSQEQIEWSMFTWKKGNREKD